MQTHIAQSQHPQSPPRPPIESQIQRILDGYIPRKDELDALQLADAQMLRSSNGTLSTSILQSIVVGVTRSRNPRRTDKNVQDAMDRICRVLSGRLHGREKTEMWSTLTMGGFPGISELFA